MSYEAEKCIHLMKVSYGLDISMYETSFLKKAIRTRMTARCIPIAEDYLLLLDYLPAESREFIAQLSNSYSEFFRNPLAFTYLEQIILPAMIGQKTINAENELRIWSAACASGQEAYSIAMLVDEIVQRDKVLMGCHIFATDISRLSWTMPKMGFTKQQT